MYKFNQRRAVVAGFTTQLVIIFLKVFNCLMEPFYLNKHFYLPDGDEILKVPCPEFPTIAVAVMVLVLVFGQELGIREPTCFLDKCCIHQTDQDKKLRGIQQLGVVLRTSTQMVALWEPEYFTRFWCIYELAAFAFINDPLQGKKALDMLPVALPKAALVGYFSWCAYWFAVPWMMWWLWAEDDAAWMRDTVHPNLQPIFCFAKHSYQVAWMALIPCIISWRAWREYMTGWRDLFVQLRTFNVAQAQCSVASDRDIITSRIEGWFGGVSEFEAWVRGPLARTVEAELASQGPMRYSMVFFSTTGTWLTLMNYAYTLFHNFHARDPSSRTCILVRSLLCFGTWTACAAPIIIRLQLLAAARLEISTWLDHVGGVLVFVIIVSICLAAPFTIIVPATPWWAVAVVIVSEGAIAVWLYLPARGGFHDWFAVPRLEPGADSTDSDSTESDGLLTSSSMSSSSGTLSI
jgi:hypothetical protein